MTVNTLTIRYRKRPDDGGGQVLYENTWCIFGNGILIFGGYDTTEQAVLAAQKLAKEGSWKDSEIKTFPKDEPELHPKEESDDSFKQMTSLGASLAAKEEHPNMDRCQPWGTEDEYLSDKGEPITKSWYYVPDVSKPTIFSKVPLNGATPDFDSLPADSGTDMSAIIQVEEVSEYMKLLEVSCFCGEWTLMEETACLKMAKIDRGYAIAAFATVLAAINSDSQGM